MAVYEFKCEKCEKITTKHQKISERTDIVTCEHCKENAHRIISMGIAKTVEGTRKGHFNSLG